MKTKPKNDWINALEEHSRSLAPATESIGKDWKSRRQLQLELDRGHTTIDRLIWKLNAQGRIERRNFRVLGPAGKLKVVPHYRLIK